MKKLFITAIAISMVALGQLATVTTSAQKSEVSPHLVISQFQAGGGNSNDEFVEIHNTSSAPFDLNGYRLVYRSDSGQTDVAIPFASWSTSTIIPAGGFYLVASNSYDGLVAPDITYNNAACSCAMAAADGGLAIRHGPNNTGTIIDSVAWGASVTNGFNEGTPTAAPGNNNGKARKQNGCQDTDQNSNDFETLTPSLPRNSSATPVQCTGAGTNLFAAMAANPSTVAPNNSTLLTVTVIPATTPPSTGINVTGNLSSIGGSVSQQFFDNGTSGDITPGDNVWSLSALIPANTTGGVRTVFATATDAQARTANVNTNITVNAPLPNEDPILFGNPSNATSDVANENNYLLIKQQYSLSYNRSRGTANWVAWRLDSSWIGNNNNGDFDIDNTLPAGWYRVMPDDYDEPVYDRGHMCPAGDRTNTQPNNSATYLMTNIIPQLPANNQGPWADLEVYCRTLADQGNEVYIFAGPHGNIGMIGTPVENEVVIPSHTWKVVLVIPNGSDDLRRVSKGTRAFGVIMSNQSISQGSPWRNFRVSVNAVEYLTGHDFFTNVPKNTQELIERRRDRE